MHTDAPVVDETFSRPATAERLERAADALRANGYEVYVIDTIVEARTLVHRLLPRDKGIFTTSSETLRLSGIAGDIDDGDEFESVRRSAAKLDGDFAAQVKLGAAPDVVIGSVHAVTESGQMVAASASGSQLGPYAAAMKAVWVVGAQKIVADLETALRRVRTHCLPLEWRRCRDVYGQPSFIGKILIFEREAMPDRGTVVLVREPIGF